MTHAAEDREVSKVGYLEKHGTTLIDNGYSIIPIRTGKKSPGFDGWEKARSTKSLLVEWLESGHRWSGVGILTKDTPAIDIDIRDDDMAQEMEQWVRENIGDAPVRVGKAPKRLMVFRTDSPFRKMRSAKYKDEWGDEHQIEILGEGQQFVAYHKHPDTGRPYTWTSDSCPLTLPAGHLPTLDVEQCQALIEHFENRADDEGWELVSRGRKQAVEIDSDNPFVEDSSPIKISDEELRSRLLIIPHPEDHDNWVDIGMALYHQFDGEETGLKLWHEWAETAHNYDADALDRRWDSFSIRGKRRAPLTARYIIKLAGEAATDAASKLTKSLHTAFLSARDVQGWEKARKAASEAEIDAISRSSLVAVAKESHERITETKVPIAEIKKAIAYRPGKSEKMPSWCNGWVYDVSDDKFYNIEKKIAASQQGFNAMHDRYSLTKKDILEGRTVPAATASALALNTHRIKTVVGRRYEPGGDAILVKADGTFANTYPEHEMPEVPAELTPKDKRNVARVKRHISHLLAKEPEQRMFLDWLSWVVQNPGKHANYAVLLQGVPGDGKTFFAELMRAVMGPTNVKMLNAKILHSDFTDWAEGHCLGCIEEIRLINDRNKFEILDTLKPFITNQVVEIHPKGKAVRNVINTSSYLLFTNYKDALPVDDTDRRYLILFSRWQQRAKLLEFEQQNPDYYADLYATIEESAGAIRGWLLQHEQEPEFDPRGKAPATGARGFMIRQAKPQFIQELDDIIEDNKVTEVSHGLIDVMALSDYMVATGHDFPAPKSLALMLQRDGYECLGRFRIRGRVKRTYYSKSPELFTDGIGEDVPINIKLIRAYLERRRQEVEEL